MDTANTAKRGNTVNTANIRRAEAGGNSAAANPEHIVTGPGETGAAIGVDSPAADLVIRTGVGTHIGAGDILTRTRTTVIILMCIILGMGTLMMIAPYQEGDSMGPDPSCDSCLRTFVRHTENALIVNLIVDFSVGF